MSPSTCHFPAHRLPTPPDSPVLPSLSKTLPSTGTAVFAEHYEVLELIGTGGYGSVVKARRRANPTVLVAVKLIPRAALHSHRLVKVQFCADGCDPALAGLRSFGNSVRLVPIEVYAMRRVINGGVVAFIDLFEDESFFYLVMEYHGDPWIGGDLAHMDRSSTSHATPTPFLYPLARSSSDLYQCIEEHRTMPEEVARYIFARMLETVESLLDHGIVHCDIKDQNLTVDAQWKVKLIDFGSAVIFDPETSRPPLLKGLVGTRRFAAPEILKGEWYDPLYAEVWSLGIVLAILVTGDIPFSSEEGAKAGERPLPRTKVHADARDLLGRCLEMEVSKRIRLEEMRHHPWMRSAFA